ncbi:hypothetical protein OA958_01075 [Bacteroidota bacterium]|nr:hypothetical protein [Bacteroidota bacterium]
MKKLIVLSILFSSIFQLNAQEVNVRGIDLSKKFVVRCTAFKSGTQKYLDKQTEENFNTALFENGLDVGDYSIERTVKDGNNREMNLSGVVNVNGDYLINIKTPQSAIIKDLSNNNKMVGSFKFKIWKKPLIERAIKIMVQKSK